MTEHSTDAVPAADTLDLAAKAAALEQRLREVEQQAERRIRETELRAEAVRAGILDLDGLRLLDERVVAGEAVEDAARTISRLKREKPWLFRSSSSSSAAEAPSAAAAKQKLATEMSFEEWRAARAELLRRK